ncbi:OmpA family protein [Stenotrophomonas pigmentata]|uniref:OmpA family protein n=1 Tax=Stenotrophomonas pigmentata TaxID=3055080 RepID=UPI0026EAA405|nr:OmpA family protein [Stenotrophomonas sp. 610A2]
MTNHSYVRPAKLLRTVYLAMALGLLPALATAQVSNTARIATPAGVTDTNPANNTSTVVTPLVGTLETVKGSDVGNGVSVGIGQTITYTLTTKVSGGPLGNTLTLTDTLSSGLNFGAVTTAGSFSCNTTAPVVCTLPAGTAEGSYSVSYTAEVAQNAVTQVSNTVVPSEGTCTDCTTTNPLVTLATSKRSDIGNGIAVERGQTIVYTVTTVVSGDGSLTVPLLLTDTLSPGLSFGGIVAAGNFSCVAGNPVRCTLPIGTVAGSYPVSYSATVNASAVTQVSNTVVPDGGTCTDCTTVNPLVEISTVKSSNVGDGAQVAIGDTLIYTLTTTITGGALTQPLALTDSMGSGLSFDSITRAGAFSCNAANPVVCSLPAGTPAGTYEVSYAATVAASATVSVRNTVTASAGSCDPCSTLDPLVDVLTSKASDIGNGTGVQVGDTITYTLTTRISGAGTLLSDLVLTDTLSAGLAFGAITNAGSFSCNGSNPVICTLPTGTAAGVYTVSYTALVQASATTSVSNTVVPSQGGCVDCSTDNPLLQIVSSKAVDVGSGTAVQRGQLLTYTVTTVISGNGSLSQPFTITDTLGAGLTFNAITSAGAFSCTTGNPVVCTLPSGTATGSYAVSYSARVSADATTSVANSVVPSEGTCTTCTTVNPLVEIATSKTVDVGAGIAVVRGQSLVYSVTTVISGGALTAPLTLTDTLGPGLGFTAITAAGSFSCNAASPVVCSLPAGTPAGSYTVNYSALVTTAATTAVHNSVVPSDGSCAVCQIDNPLSEPVVNYTKSVLLPAGQTEVRAGDSMTFTLTTTITVAPTTDVVTLTDTPGPGLQFGTLGDVGNYTCTAGSPLVCSLPAGTAVGTYTLSYTAVVTSAASGSVRNAVLASGGDNPTCTGNCGTDTPVLTPIVDVSKSADPSSGTQVERGQVLRYTLTAVIGNAPITQALVLVDTADAGLTITGLPAQCSRSGTTVTCTLPVGTAVGVHNLSYDATVNEQAGSVVNNSVVPSGGGPEPPGCDNCSTQHPVDDPLLRITKTAGVREVKVGDLVRYTLRIENVSGVDLIDGSIVDSTPAGFSFVSGSLQQSGGDPLAASGVGPVRLSGLNLPAGGVISVAYLMRVGAGVRQGTHINQAQAMSPANTPISNIATAEVVLSPDPLLDESLIIGTVFDDRDGDGWQDRADLTSVSVQGGFAAADYVPGSTVVVRNGAEIAQSDASVPLLKGLALGEIAARQSDADPAQRHQVVIRQRLHAANFSDDFVLTSAEGFKLRMDTSGQTRVQLQGDASKGLSAALPQVERRVSVDTEGTTVEYVISNEGVDERGIPGVRIASVEGLLMETDQFGRYHLVGVNGGAWERGRNFILKVDPVTLPAGAEFTTDNPLLRRVTPGLPVRFDWGVKLPPGRIAGGEELVELALGKVLFAPGSSDISERYGSVIDRIAEQMRGRRGEIQISADGEPTALAFARATALRNALQSRLQPSELEQLRFSIRNDASSLSPLIAGWSSNAALLGTILFDNDKAIIRPEFKPLIAEVAAALERDGGGQIGIVGHTDVHGSYAYNIALGLRRARAVQEAIAALLSPSMRGKVRVQAESDPNAPLDVPLQEGTP